MYFEDCPPENNVVRKKSIYTELVEVRVSEDLPAASFFDISIHRHIYIYFGYPVWTTAKRLIME